MTDRSRLRNLLSVPGWSLAAALILVIFLALYFAPGRAAAWSDWWMTPDQQGQTLFDEGAYAAAAERFQDPEWRGIAYFRAGDFENAAAVFGRIRSSSAAYNRGNALVMLGRYDDAIGSYQKALQMRPGWTEAEQNLAIARARKDLLAPPDDDYGGTGGALEADEIVFDDSGRVNRSGQEVTVEADAAMSDSEMRAVWLRRAQNDPTEFLRARFSYQLFRDQQEEERDE